MPSLHPIPRAARIILAALVAVPAAAMAQSTKPPPQQLNLHDPTPRPPDLEQKYASDPAELARQQQLAAIKAAQIRQQVVAATDTLLQLTQQLETDIGKRPNGAAMTPQVVEAERIEKLARTVKDKTKAQ